MYAITEFPFFSFWLGDMHPHVMSLPFSLLAIALALQTIARPELPSYGRSRHGWIDLIATGVVLGALYVINSWDFPTYLLLFLLALLLRHARDTNRAGPGAYGIGWRAYGIQAALVVGAAFVLFLPFHLTFKSLVGAKEPLVDLPILATITKTIGAVGWPKTPLHTILIIFGLFLCPVLVWVASVALRGRRWDAPWLITSVILAIGAAIGFPLIALVPLAFYTLRAALEQARTGDLATSFALAAFGLTCLIGFGTEIIYIRDVFGNRMNTIFKFYYQIWVILGVLAGYGLWAIFTTNRNLAGRVLDGVVFVPLLAGALLYPALTLNKLYSEGKPIGLNGTTPRDRSPDGAAAIAWLRQHTAGDAVIIEAVERGPVYGYDTAGLGTSGVSASTGLATVMGWTNHQQQWRGGDPITYAQIEPRRADVEQIYTTLDPNQARTLLQKYGVRYVYVGTTERASYPAEGIAKFDQIGTPVFQQGDVTIYQVGS
jgi:YYY domain-containing protein